MEKTRKQDEVLATLTDLGVSLAQDLYRRALAATDDAVACDLSLAFHRISRSVRQTLALDAKLERDRTRAGRDAARETATHVQAKRNCIRKVLSREIWSEYEDDEAETLVDDLEGWISDAAEEETFLDAPVDHLIARIRENLGLAANDGAPEAQPPDEEVQRSSG